MVDDPLTIGREFTSFQESKQEVKEWILAKGESFRKLKNDNRCLVLICKLESFQFRVRITNRKGIGILPKYLPHNCPPSTFAKDRHLNSASWIAKNEFSQSSVQADTNVSAKGIVQTQLHRYGQNTNYMAAWRGRDQIKHELYGSEAESFQKIPALLKFLGELPDSNENENSGAWTKLELERISHRFRRCGLSLKQAPRLLIIVLDLLQWTVPMGNPFIHPLSLQSLP